MTEYRQFREALRQLEAIDLEQRQLLKGLLEKRHVPYEQQNWPKQNTLGATKALPWGQGEVRNVGKAGMLPALCVLGFRGGW